MCIYKCISVFHAHVYAIHNYICLKPLMFLVLRSCCSRLSSGRKQFSPGADMVRPQCKPPIIGAGPYAQWPGFDCSAEKYVFCCKVCKAMYSTSSQANVHVPQSSHLSPHCQNWKQCKFHLCLACTTVVAGSLVFWRHGRAGYRFPRPGKPHRGELALREPWEEVGPGSCWVV